MDNKDITRRHRIPSKTPFSDQHRTNSHSIFHHGPSGPQDGETSDDSLSAFKDCNPRVPLCYLPICMQDKRLTSELRQRRMHNMGYWTSWRRSPHMKRLKRFRDQFPTVICRLLPWRYTFITIEGRFGMGVKAYFVFLTYLLILNLLLSLIIIGTVLIPTLVYRGNGVYMKGPPSRENGSIVDIFLGSGFLARSPLFYGFYERGALEMVCSNTSLLFLIGITCVFVLSLVMVIRRTVIGYKYTWITGSHNKISIINKVFSGWNFCIQDDSAAALKHSLIRNELKMDLEEQGFHQRLSQRTLKQKMTLYVLRVLLNVLVLVLLAGSFCMIFFATQYSKEKKEPNVESWIVNLILGYLPAITITTANYLLPRIFQKISVFEDYSLTTQLNLTLLRSTFLKLASLGIYILFLFKMRKSDCWENEFGKQMYQLSMFDLLACFINTFLISFPAKWLRERYPSSVLARLVKPQFIITLHVLDLVYSQTVTWLGVFYCPLLPCICTLKLTAVFYMKKCCVLRCCVPAQKMVRTHSSSVLFHFMLLLGLIIAAVHLSVSLSADTTGVPCGPFSNSTVSEVVNECVGSLPHVVQSTLRHMDSKAIALPLIMLEIVILTCFVSQGRANHKTIERLNDMLVMCNSDKRFLVKEHSSGLSH